MLVSVVIPNYNGIKFIKTCLDSLEQQSHKEIEVIIVDNASEDGSKELIEEEYKSVELIALDQNYGFSAAVNIGIKKAKSEYVILLNNDTEADEFFVQRLAEEIHGKDNVFSCSSKMISFHNRDIMDDAGDLLTIIGWAFQRGIGQSTDKYGTSKKVFTACAGAAIYRKRVFEEIGYFDEKHFAYLEDIDVGYRAKIHGYKNMYCSSAIVYHIGSATSGSKYNEFKVRLAARNNIYLNYKNMPVLQIVLNFPFLLLGYAVKILFFHKIGFGKTYVNGLMEGFRTARECKKVKFKFKNLFHYILIEIELIWNTIIYAKDFLNRRLQKC